MSLNLTTFSRWQARFTAADVLRVGTWKVNELPLSSVMTYSLHSAAGHRDGVLGMAFMLSFPEGPSSVLGGSDTQTVVMNP